jgi:putative ABC transport system permease protein
MITGRAPARRGEIALGSATARELGVGVGDTVELTLPEMESTSKFRVVGLTIFNDPVNGQNSAGDGAIIAPEVLAGLGPYLPQSIAVRLNPTADRRAALDSLARDFPGSIRPVAPQPDLRNLDRLRAVPWLVALLVSILAAATLIHALVTMLSRRRRSLAVLATIGFTRRQRLSVGFSASTVLLAAATIIGIPLGIIGGRQVWHYLAASIDIPSGPVVPWIVAVVAPLIDLLVAVVVALLTGWRLSRRSPAELLRAE